MRRFRGKHGEVRERKKIQIVSRCAAAAAAATTLQHKIKFIGKAQDNISREGDKLISHLQVKNYIVLLYTLFKWMDNN